MRSTTSCNLNSSTAFFLSFNNLTFWFVFIKTRGCKSVLSQSSSRRGFSESIQSDCISLSAVNHSAVSHTYECQMPHSHVKLWVKLRSCSYSNSDLLRFKIMHMLVLHVVRLNFALRLFFFFSVIPGPIPFLFLIPTPSSTPWPYESWHWVTGGCGWNLALRNGTPLQEHVIS